MSGSFFSFSLFVFTSQPTICQWVEVIGWRCGWRLVVKIWGSFGCGLLWCLDLFLSSSRFSSSLVFFLGPHNCDWSSAAHIYFLFFAAFDTLFCISVAYVFQLLDKIYLWIIDPNISMNVYKSWILPIEYKEIIVSSFLLLALVSFHSQIAFNFLDIFWMMDSIIHNGERVFLERLFDPFSFFFWS